MLLEVLTWLTFGLAMCAAAQHLVRIRWPSHGAHVRPEMTQPGDRRDAWGGLRYALLPMAGAVYYLADWWKYGAARWLLGIITFMVVAPDVISWLRSHLGRKPGGPTAEHIRVE